MPKSLPQATPLEGPIAFTSITGLPEPAEQDDFCTSVRYAWQRVNAAIGILETGRRHVVGDYHAEAALHALATVALAAEVRELRVVLEAQEENRKRGARAFSADEDIE